MKHWWLSRIAKGLAFFALAVIVLGGITMLLWNALVPDLFHGPLLSFWQAVGLLLLTHILLRGWSPWRHHGGWHHDRWKHRFEEKLAAMTPEEREHFRAEYRHRCGWDPGAGKEHAPATGSSPTV
jgi:hypothetical protein